MTLTLKMRDVDGVSTSGRLVGDANKVADARKSCI